MQYTIQIPKPCHEPWQEMSPANNGRHCMQCSKTVIDFTGWAEEKIQLYLQQQGATKVCGRFRTEQLGAFDTVDFVNSVAFSPLPLYKKIAAIFLVAFGMLQMSCNTGQQKMHQVGSIAIVDTPQKENRNIIMGGIKPPPTQKHKHKVKVTDTTVLKGDVMYIPIDITKKKTAY